MKQMAINQSITKPSYVEGRITMMNILKKLLVPMLLLCLLCPAALAEDFTAMTRDELLKYIAAANSELWVRDNNIKQSQTLPTPIEGLTIYITDYEYNSDSSYEQLTITFVFHNNSSEDADLYLTLASINDWEIGSYYGIMVDAGYKKRSTIKVSASNLDMLELSSVNDIYAMRIEVAANRNGDNSYGWDKGEGAWYYSLTYDAESDCLSVVDYDLRDYSERK